MRAFELNEPGTLAEATGLLDADDPTVRPIAGGTALMLMMKTGVFQPARLVSLRGVEAQHSAITRDADGTLHIGALATLSALGRSAEAKAAAPVIQQTLKTLSNVRVRNVATVGGALAHGDPHMDLPPVMMALDARVTAVSPTGMRTLAVAELYTGYYETALARNELISEVVVPARVGWRAAYVKLATRCADDWPTLGIAVALKFDGVEGGAVSDVRMVVGAATETPTRLLKAEAELKGKTINDTVLARMSEAASEETELIDDVRGSAAYKKVLLRVHATRAIRNLL